MGVECFEAYIATESEKDHREILVVEILDSLAGLLEGVIPDHDHAAVHTLLEIRGTIEHLRELSGRRATRMGSRPAAPAEAF